MIIFRKYGRIRYEIGFYNKFMFVLETTPLRKISRKYLIFPTIAKIFGIEHFGCYTMLWIWLGPFCVSVECYRLKRRSVSFSGHYGILSMDESQYVELPDAVLKPEDTE